MSVGRICGREVDIASRSESVKQAAERMLQRKVGTLVVIDEGKPVGLLTDRDLATRVVARSRDPNSTKVEEVMTAPIRTIEEDAPIESALARMRSVSVRRLPVVNGGGRLVGILSLDDVLALLAEEMVQVGYLLEKQTPRSLGAFDDG